MQFVKQTRIGAPPADVFAFHESPGALLRLTPPWERVQLLRGGDSIRPGARVVLSVRIGPFRTRWIAEHTEYDPGRMFADRQVEGPFAAWYHRHLFLDDHRGGTLLRDEVDYAPPLGALGRFLAGGFIDAKLRRMFDYRHETTRSIVESGDFPRPANAGRNAIAGTGVGREGRADHVA
jgi:ligand-binding SRPBCC domain-containing protein